MACATVVQLVRLAVAAGVVLVGEQVYAHQSNRSLSVAFIDGHIRAKKMDSSAT